MKRRVKREKPRQESNCLECENAIFDEIFGEYKCRHLKRRIKNVKDHTGCEAFNKVK